MIDSLQGFTKVSLVLKNGGLKEKKRRCRYKLCSLLVLLILCLTKGECK